MKLLNLLAVVSILLASCARAPLTDPARAFRLGAAPSRITDRLDLGGLRAALERNLAAFSAPGSNVPAQFTFAGRVIPREEYRRALEALRPELESWERFLPFIQANFDFYEVYGGKDWGDVFTTGYYEPVVEGSDRATPRFSRPLYRTPPDLVTVDVKAFAERTRVDPKTLGNEQKSATPTWRGRYLADSRRIVPYPERSEIVGKNLLQGKHLELAWLDPVDAFFLEIQGSGTVEMNGRRLRVGYDSQNGAPYVPIGKFLTHAIPLEEMSMQRIRRYLAGVSPAERDAVLAQNPSYVFFRPIEGEAVTYSGAEVTGGRTIATDRVLFPKGVLSYFEIEEPTFADDHAIDPAAWEERPRFVFDQDTGGAIRGGGRVDLFVGRGPVAERTAGVMKRNGKLWALAPKLDFLARLFAAPAAAAPSGK